MVTAGPVKSRALELGIPVLQPSSLKDEGIQSTLRELAPDLIVVVAYGLLLPPAVLAIPRLGCINVHASLLPRWRGASPIQSAILAGDPETGVSIMQLEAGLDTGPVYGCARLAISPTETAGELEVRLAELGADTLGGMLERLLAGTLRAEPQPATGVTYAGRIRKADGRIDWQEPAEAIARRIRAFNPWPVAETLLDGHQLRCFAGTALAPTDRTLAARVSADGSPAAEAPCGGIVAVGTEGIDVQAGTGRVRLTEIQVPGRARIAAADFGRGRPLKGKVLGG